MDPSTQPRVLVIGGPNGAGKSTLAERVVLAAGLRHFVDADTIARGLSRYDPESVAAQAGRIMLDRIRGLAERRTDFAFETTLAGRGHASFLRRLTEDGYHCELVAVWLGSAALAVERVAKRVADGGHHIPRHDIERRYHRAAWNLINLYIPVAGTWRIYDNSSEQPYVLIARGGRDQATELLDERAYRGLEAAADKAG